LKAILSHRCIFFYLLAVLRQVSL